MASYGYRSVYLQKHSIWRHYTLELLPVIAIIAVVPAPLSVQLKLTVFFTLAWSARVMCGAVDKAANILHSFRAIWPFGANAKYKITDLTPPHFKRVIGVCLNQMNVPVK
jgi:hypothetical protein